MKGSTNISTLGLLRLHVRNADSEIRMDEEKSFVTNLSVLIDLSMKIVQGGFKSIDLANAVVFVFAFVLENPFCFSKLAGMLFLGIYQ